VLDHRRDVERGGGWSDCPTPACVPSQDANGRGRVFPRAPARRAGDGPAARHHLHQVVPRKPRTLLVTLLRFPTRDLWNSSGTPPGIPAAYATWSRKFEELVVQTL
jgi:hypothetical protein